MGQVATERLRGRAGQEQRKRRLMRSYGLCEDCLAAGITRRADIVDHILPLAKGGPDTDENTRNLCDECHRHRTAEQFGHRTPRPTIGLDGWPLDTSWSKRK